MLAIRPAFVAASAALTLVFGSFNEGWGQQPPSRTQSPSPFGPPNVHVPSQRQQMFSPPAGRPQADGSTSRNAGARQRNGGGFQAPQVDPSVRPTGFQEGTGGNGAGGTPFSPFPKNAGGPGLPAGTPPAGASMPAREPMAEMPVPEMPTRGMPRGMPAVNAPLDGPRALPGPPKFTLPQAEASPAVATPAAASPRMNAAANSSPRANGTPAAAAQGQESVPAVAPANSEMPGGVVVPAMGKVGDSNAGVMPTGFSMPKADTPGLSNAITKPNAAVTDNRFNLTSPAIHLETYGPQSIGIHKKSQFKIIARNNSNLEAERISVAITMPTWVKLEAINASQGRKESGEDQKSSRVTWTLDRLAANSAQTITVDVIPTKAERFDLQVELVQQPRNGMAQVEVTEPRLEMKIVGPNEVLFGETAVYNVTVRNPGTGRAEGVSVMLPEALGGERATLGDIGPNEEKNFKVELLARTAGALDLATTATATGNLQTSAAKQILVRRAALATTIKGPPMKYSGTVGVYEIEVRNTGDASARDVVAALALPNGVKYLEGIEAVDTVESGLRWTIGNLDSGDVRTYRVALQLNADGKVQMELGARAAGDIASVGQTATVVETLEDVVLSIDEPKGPQPSGEEVEYVIHVRNRGSRAANNLNLVMNFSEGIEPTSASGHGFQLAPGQVVFKAIDRINAGEEVVVKVQAKAGAAGTHIFRAQLTGENAETREMCEGTTRFYGDDLTAPQTPAIPASGPTTPPTGGGSFKGFGN
ncbi:MAG: hypothetical protein ACK49R_16990 [Planctomycetota bacterium]